MWLTSSKLCKYVCTSRKLLSINTNNVNEPKPGTWLACLPTKEVDNEGNVIDSNDPSPHKRVCLFNQNSHPKAKISHKDYYEKYFAPRNHKSVDVDDDEENHGLACTCCGIKFGEVLSKSDISQMKINKMVYGFDTMITKKTVDADRNTSVTLQGVPDRRDASNDPGLVCDRMYTNFLTRKDGVCTRFAPYSGKMIEDPEEVRIFDEIFDEMERKQKGVLVENAKKKSWCCSSTWESWNRLFCGILWCPC